MDKQKIENLFTFSSYAQKTGISVHHLIRAATDTRVPIYATVEELGIFKQVDQSTIETGFDETLFRGCSPVFVAPANVEPMLLGSGYSKLEFKDRYFSKKSIDGTYEYYFKSASKDLESCDLHFYPSTISNALEELNFGKGPLFFDIKNTAICFRGAYFKVSRTQYEVLKSIHDLTINRPNYGASLDEIRNNISETILTPETFQRSIPNLLRFSKENGHLKNILVRTSKKGHWRLAEYQVDQLYSRGTAVC